MEWLDFLKYFSIVVAIFYILYLALLYFKQESMLFNSQPAAVSYIDFKVARVVAEKDFKMDMKDLSLKTKEGNLLSGILLSKIHKDPNQSTSVNNILSEGKPTIIYFHPNSYNMIDVFRFCATTISKLNCNIVSFALRGYGNSAGKPTAEGLKIDGEAVIDFVLKNNSLAIDQNNVYLLGRSLGASVSIQSVQKYDHLVKGVILENAFSSMDDLVKDKYPELLCFRKFILKIKIENIPVVSSLKCPLLYLVSRDDDVVPYQNSLRLIEASRNSKLLDYQIFNLAGHSELYEFAYKAYYNKISNFLSKCQKGKFQEDHVLDLEDNILLKS